MGIFTSAMTLKYLLPILLCHVSSCDGDLTSGMPSAMTHGEIFKSEIGKFYTAQPSDTFFNTTPERCIMILLSKLQYVSMNVVEENDLNVVCQMFTKKSREDIEEEGILFEREGSTYYEKSRVTGYIKANESIVFVEGRDEKPGIVYFQPLTGYYQVRLEHVDGGISCGNGYTNFGCKWVGGYSENIIILVKDFRGNIILQRYDFTEWDANWEMTPYVATSHCIYLVQGSMYSFWFLSDFYDSAEHLKVGTVSFEFLVKPCND